MLAGEKKRAPDGYEVALFPCEAMYLTEARVPPEHDVLALDFLPRNTEGARISPMNVYAPFSGTIVYTGNDHNCILESDDFVHFADGTLYKMRVLVAHSWNAPTLGAHYNQGDLFYTTGNYGQSHGEHLHMEVAVAVGSYWNDGGIGLRNGYHMWDALYVDDTVLLRTGDFNWKEYGHTPPPTPTSKSNFIGVYNSIYNVKRKEVNIYV